MLSPVGYGGETFPMRLSYRRFDAVVERAQREVLRSAPASWRAIAVRTVSAEGPFNATWGEFYPPNGPIVIYQLAYENMPDQENYYRQIKAVLIHEYEHSTGEMHGEPVRFYAAAP
jgi:hypothetical protein